MVKTIGTPYSEMDCYELTVDFYKKLLGIDLNSLQYKQPVEQKEIDQLFNLESANFKKVSDRKFGDIIVIRVLGLAAHIGVYLEGRRFLHTTSKLNCVIDDLTKYEKRIVGFYRWPSLYTE